MIKFIKKSVLLLAVAFALTNAKAQKIEYDLGSKSDLTDSLVKVIEFYKGSNQQASWKKLNLYAGVNLEMGELEIFVSHYSEDDQAMKKVTKASNRFLVVTKKIKLPVVFAVDVLHLADRAYVTMNGWYIRAKKDEKGIWRVIKMNPTF